jgi:hypothetical protein
MTRVIVALLSLTLVAAFIAAEAQPAGKLPLIGNLRIDSASQDPHWLEQDLREHGYVEGQNIAIESDTRKGDRSAFLCLRRSWST